MIDLSHTIEPKSDQMNADDLLAGAITITVTAVTAADSSEQPVNISYEGDNGKPFKPCKSMRRVLIQAWGVNGSDWVGKSMTLFCDPTVKFGGQAVGGIRISHLSHIDRDMNMMLTVTRAKRSPYSIKKLVQQSAPAKAQPYPDAAFNAELAKMKASIEGGKSTAEKIIAYLELTAPVTAAQRKVLHSFSKKNAETQEATTAASTPGYAAMLSKIQNCSDVEVLDMVGDDLRDLPEGNERTKLEAAYTERRAALSAE